MNINYRPTTDDLSTAVRNIVDMNNSDLTVRRHAEVCLQRHSAEGTDLSMLVALLTADITGGRMH